MALPNRQIDTSNILDMLEKTPKKQIDTSSILDLLSQEQPAQEQQPKSFLQKTVGVVQKIDQPGKGWAENIRAGYKKFMGVIPSEADLTNAINNKEWTKLQKWALDGVVLPETDIKDESLKREMRSRGLFAEWASVQARGKINRGYTKSTLGNIGRGILEGVELLTGAENVLQPSQLALNLLIPGVGGKIVSKMATKGLSPVEKAVVERSFPKIAQQLRSYSMGDVPDYMRGSLEIAANNLDRVMTEDTKKLFNRVLKNKIPMEDLMSSQDGTALKRRLIDIANKRFKTNEKLRNQWIDQINQIPDNDYGSIMQGWKDANAHIARGSLQAIKAEELRKAQAGANQTLIQQKVASQQQTARQATKPIITVERPTMDQLARIATIDNTYNAQILKNIDKAHAQVIIDNQMLKDEFIASYPDIIKVDKQQGSILKTLGFSQTGIDNLSSTSAKDIIDKDITINTLRNMGYGDKEIATFRSLGEIQNVIDNDIPPKKFVAPEKMIVEQPIEQPVQEPMPETPQDVVGGQQIPQEQALPEQAIQTPEQPQIISAKDIPATKIFEGTKEYESGKHDISWIGELNGKKYAFSRNSGIEEITDRLYNEMLAKDASENNWIYREGKLQQTSEQPPVETPPEVKATQKPEWKMNTDEYLRTRVGNRNTYEDIEIVSPGKIADLTRYHKALVADAIKRGDPVPESVLADYTDLKPKATEQVIPTQQAYKPTNDLQELIKRVEATHRAITYHPRNKTVSISGRQMPEKEAVKYINEMLANDINNPNSQYNVTLNRQSAEVIPATEKAGVAEEGKKSDKLLFIVDGHGKIAKVTRWTKDDQIVVVYPAKEGGIRSGAAVEGGGQAYEYKPEVWRPAKNSDFVKEIRPSGSERMNFLRQWHDEFKTFQQNVEKDVVEVQTDRALDTSFPTVEVNPNDITIAPEDMQFKAMDNVKTGTNKKEEISGVWDELKAGKILLWQSDEGDLILANGHHRVKRLKEINAERKAKGQSPILIDAQILKETDPNAPNGIGWSKEDARLKAAEINIADERGTIYDRVAILRNDRTALSADEALGKRSSVSERARKAYAIAYDSEDNTINAFNRGEISSDQAEIIARVAPNDYKTQAIGIKLAKTNKTGADLENNIQALKMMEADAELEGSQLDLFGEKDNELFKRADEIAIVVKRIKKEINDKILSVKGILKRPKEAGEMGAQLKDAYGTEQEVKRLEAELGRWDKWYEEPQGSDIRQRIDAELQAENKASTAQTTMEFGNKSVDTEAFDTEAFSKMTREEKLIEVNKSKEKIEPPVGLGINIIRKPKLVTGIADDVLDRHKPMANLLDRFIRPAKEMIANAQGRQINSMRAFKKTMQALTFEPLGELKIDAKLYGEEIFNRVRNWFRTDIIGSSQKVVRLAQEDLDIVYHDMDANEIKTFWDLIASKTALSQYEKFYTQAIREGLTPAGAIKEATQKIPKDIDIGDMQLLYDDLYSTLNSNPEGRRTIDGMERYKIFLKEILAEEIKRGNIKEVDWNGFYYPRQLLKYYDPDAFTYLPRTAQKQWRRHMQQQIGGTEDVVINEEVLRQYFLEHHMANTIDDFAIKARQYSDIYHGPTGLRGIYTDDELKMLMGGHTAPAPNHPYIINGRRYVGSQYQKGNTMFVDTIVSADRLDRKINDFLDEVGDDPEAWQVREFLDSLTTDEPGEGMKRMAMMIGKRYKTFLIPEPIHQVINNLNPKSSSPTMRYMKQYTQYWKIMTLMNAGLPYQGNNFFGDWWNNVVIGDIRAVKYLPIIGRMRGYYRNMAGQETPKVRTIRQALERQPVALSEEERIIADILEQENVLMASGINESTRLNQTRGITRGFRQAEMMWNKANFVREANARIAIVATKVDEFLATGGRIENGKLVGNGKMTSITFGDDIKGLSPNEKAGYLGRMAGVDYLFATDFFRDTLNGAGIPFITWSHKNAVNYGRFAKNSLRSGLGAKMKGGFWERAQAFLPVAAVVPGAMAIYNNTQTSKAKLHAWRNSGDAKNNPYMYILNTKAEMGQPDDQPNKAIIWDPKFPSWLAAQYLGFDKVLNYINAVQQGRMSIKEAVGKVALDIPTGPFRFAYKLLHPLGKFFLDIKYNKNSFTGQKIFPDNAPVEIKADYSLGLFMKYIITPMGSNLYQNYGANSFRATEWTGDSLRDAHRIGGAISAKMAGKESPISWDEIKEYMLRNEGPIPGLNVFRALGFRQIDLQKTEINELEQYMEKKKGIEAVYIDELTKAYISDIVDKATNPESNPNSLQNKLGSLLQSGKLKPEQATISGITLSASPEDFAQRLAQKFERNMKADTTIKAFIRKYTKASDVLIRDDIENAYQLFRKKKLMETIKNAPENVQIDMLDILMKDLDYETLNQEGD